MAAIAGRGSQTVRKRCSHTLCIVVGFVICACGAAIVASGVQPPDNKLQALVRDAQQADQHGDLDRAIQLYRQILEIRPHWISAEFNLALAYHFQKKYPEALARLSEVIQHDPKRSDAYLFRGIAYYQMNGYANAIRSLQRCLELRPKSEEARFYLASSYYQLNEYGRAVVEYLKYIHTQPSHNEVYFQLVECYRALATSAAVPIYKDSSSTYFSLLLQAENALDRLDTASAETQISRALELDPNSPEGWFLSGKLKDQKGDSSDAEVDFRRSLQNEVTISTTQGVIAAELQRPTHCETAALLAQALCQAQTNNLSAATASVLAVDTSTEKDMRTLYWVTRIYLRLAAAAVAQLAKESPDSAQLKKLYARDFDQKGKRDEAAAAFEEAVTRDPHDESTFVEYARFRSKGQEFEEAIALLQKAVALAPYDNRAQALLGEAYFENNDLKRAVSYFRKALEFDPQNEQARIYLAKTLHSLDQRSEAIAVLEKAPTDTDGRVSYLLSTYYSQEGEAEKAKKAMQIFKERRKK